MKCLDDAWDYLNHRLWKANIGEVFIVGGASVFEAMIPTKECVSCFVTKINKDFETDTKLYKDAYVNNHFRKHEITAEKACKEGGFTYQQIRYFNYKGSDIYDEIRDERAFEESRLR